MSDEQHTQYRASIHAPGALQFLREPEADRQSPPEPRTLWCSRLKAHRSAPVLGLVAILTLVVLSAACGGDTSSGIGAGDRDSGADAVARTDTRDVVTDAAADSVPDAPDLELSSSDGDFDSERDANFDTFTEPDALPELDVVPESDLLPELDASDATVDGFGDPDASGLDAAADFGADGSMDSGVDAPTDTTNTTDTTDTTDTSGAADLADGGTPAALRDLRILVIGQSDFSPRGTAHYLAELFEAHGAGGMTTAAYVVTHDLLEYFYVWRAREERLAVLADDWDFIVLMDASNNQTRSPEMHFEGVRALAELSHEHGALPILVTTVDADPGSLAEELAWRIGLGTGCIVAPASVVVSELSAQRGERGIVAAATIFTALTGETAAVAGYLPDAANQARWEEIAEAALVQHELDEVTTHYVGDFDGVVRLDNMVGEEPYRFISSGTSSELGWAGAMGLMLDHEGIDYGRAHLNCSASRNFDATCRDQIEPYLRADVYQVLYARYYSVSTASIHEQSDTSDIMPQIYDRHSDADRDGTSGLNYIRRDSQDTYDLAARLGLAWLPQRINFGRIKVEQPDTRLSDGVHALAPIQRGLAAMSFVSRTGRAPRLDGLDAATERAVRHGEQTIRQLATLSRTGETIADVPDSRVAAPAIDLSDEPVLPDPPYYGETIALPPWEDELGVTGEDMCLLSFQSLDPPSYTRPPDATECFDVDLGSNTGQVTFNPCWAIPDRIYRWTAPTDGRWVFKTLGPPQECGYFPEGDPMLRIAQPHCDGDTFAQNDDGGWDRSWNWYDAYTKLDLAEGQSVYIEHSHSDRGISTSNLYVYRIDVERLFCDDEVDNDFDMRSDCGDPDCLGAPECPDPCPTADLGSAVGPGLADGVVDAQSDLYPYCNRAPSWYLRPDVSLRWVAPATGRYQFDTIGSSGDEALTVLRGPCDCGGTEDVLGCGIWSDYDEVNAIVTVDVNEGEELTLLINTMYVAADWVINVTEVTE